MNKKLLGLTALTALMLAGCGGEQDNPDVKPTPTPSQGQVTPYVDPYKEQKEDLIARISALGEAADGSFTLKKGAKVGEETLDADLVSSFVQTSDYSYASGIGGTIKYVVDTEVGYYNVGYKDDAIYSKWGRAYDSVEEYEEKQLVSGLSSIMAINLFKYNSTSKTFSIVSPTLIEALATKLGYTNLFGKFPGLIDVKVEEDNSITFSIKDTAMSENYSVVVNLEHNEDARDLDIEEYMAQQTAFPSSGVDPFEAQKTAFASTYTGSVTQSTKPYEGLMQGVLLFNEYVTPSSYTRATAGDYTDYESERFVMQYVLAGANKNVKNGIYAWLAEETDTESVIQDYIDKKQTDYYEFEDLSDYYGTTAFWYESGYYNPKTAIDYDISDKFFDEVTTEYGQGYRMLFGREYIKEGKTATIGVADMEELTDCFKLTNLYTEGQYSGYDVDEWHYADLYITHKEGEVPSASNPVEMLMMESFHGQYKVVDDDGNIEKVYDPEDVLIVKRFYDFGKTTNPYPNIIGNFIEPVTVSFEQGASVDVLERDSVQLKVVTDPEKYATEGEYTSSNESIATVDENGLVETHKPGSANVTYTIGGASKSIKINVGYEDTIITMKQESATVTVGDYLKIPDYIDSIVYASDEVVVDPENYGSMTYKSSSTTIASVNSNGKLTAKKAGEVTITIKRGNSSTTFTVIVEEASSGE